MKGILSLRVDHKEIPCPFPGRYPTRFAVLGGSASWGTDGVGNTVVGTNQFLGGMVTDRVAWPLLYLGRPNSLRVASAIRLGFLKFGAAAILEFQRDHTLLARYDGNRRVVQRRPERRLPYVSMTWSSPIRSLYYVGGQAQLGYLDAGLSLPEIRATVEMMLDSRVYTIGSNDKFWRYYGVATSMDAFQTLKSALRKHRLILPRPKVYDDEV